MSPAAHDIIRQDAASVAGRLGPHVGQLSGATVLVTGGGGFLGSSIAEAIAYVAETGLTDVPPQLVLMSRLAPTDAHRLAHLRERPDVTWILGDLAEPLAGPTQIDFIVHAASPASPSEFLADPVGTAKANSAALMNLLETAGTHGTRSLLYLSSSEVYGSPSGDDIPTPEDYPGCVPFTEPRAWYAESKRFGETLCLAYHRQHGTPARIVRPFHLFGPGMRADDSRLIPAMMMRGVRGESFELAGAGTETRTYGYVTDGVAAILLALLAGCAGEAYNIGSGGPEDSVLDVTMRIAEVFGRAEDVAVATRRAEPGRQGTPNRVCPDVTKMRRELGYDFDVSLDEGLARTAMWFREVYG